MHLYPILVIGVLLAWDGGMGLAAEGLGLGGWAVTGIACGPVLGVLAVTYGGVRWYRRKLMAGGTPSAVLAAARLARGARWLLLAHFAAVVLIFGWLGTVRSAVGDGVLLDELVTIAPLMVGVLGTWWVYYPIERRVREAVMLRRLDLGRDVFPLPSRGRYVLTQAQMHLLLLLVPLLMILTVAELIELAVEPWREHVWIGWISEAGVFLAAVGVIMIAPALSRLVLDVEPLSSGPVHDDLTEICQIHGVRVRRLLVWKTDGTMINAAVMGLIGRLRYVLLTDALLASMTRGQVRAVLAHEIGHIRRRHLPWMVASLLATMMLTVMCIYVPVQLLAPPFIVGAEPWPVWVELATGGAALIIAFGVFGWISRRFERQADSFAALHLGRPADPAHNDEPARITAEAAETMCSALQTIARLDIAPPGRPSWRHGSIVWRQRYLRSIVGQSVSSLAIDRQVRWVKGVTAVVLFLVLGYLFLAAWQQFPAAFVPDWFPPAAVD